MHSTNVAVTGFGVASPLGNCISTFRSGLFTGKSGVTNIRGSIVADNFPVPYAALTDSGNLINQDKVSDIQLKTRASLLAHSVACETLEYGSTDHGIDGVIFNNAEGLTFEVLQKIFREHYLEFDIYRQEYVIETICKLLEEHGYNEIPVSKQILVNSACSSGNQAIGLAMQQIKEGEWNSALVGGVDTRCTPSNLMCFHLLNALTVADVSPEKASKPFSLDRSGFVRGEGAAALMLESVDRAKSRGAKIYGIVAGYGMTSDAYRLTDGREDCTSVVQAMKEAIEESGLNLEEVNVISAHGTSTLLNDSLETKAIKKLFGDHAYNLSITALKSQIGHTTIAAGLIETISCLLMLEEQTIAPTINYNCFDPECDLDYTPNQSKKRKFDSILNNNFGFGGQNACLLIKKYEECE